MVFPFLCGGQGDQFQLNWLRLPEGNARVPQRRGWLWFQLGALPGEQQKAVKYKKSQIIGQKYRLKPLVRTGALSETTMLDFLLMFSQARREVMICHGLHSSRSW